MRCFPQSGLTVVLVALSFGAAAADNQIKCPEMPMPEGTAVMVAPDIAFNGVPMEVRELHSKDSPERVLDFYRERWKRNRAGSMESQIPNWRVISTVDARCLYSAQVQASGSGTLALLGVTRLLERGARPSQPGAGFPMMPGSSVFNDIVHHDGAKNGRTLTLFNQHSYRDNVAFYRSSLPSSGWVPTVDRAVDERMHVLVMKRGFEETSVTIAVQGGGVTVVANVVDRP
jgi:hypothetical protein